jgi:hypothetical protein
MVPRPLATGSFPFVTRPSRPCSVDRTPVSSQSLPKTGIFGIAAGDFRDFQPPAPGIGSPETDPKSQKPAINGLSHTIGQMVAVPELHIVAAFGMCLIALLAILRLSLVRGFIALPN